MAINHRLETFGLDTKINNTINPTVLKQIHHETMATEESDDTLPPCDEDMKRYFIMIGRMVARAYEVAEKARAKGFDPETKVEIPAVSHLATRVERLVGPEGIAKRIEELGAIISKREELAIKIAEEIADTLRNKGMRDEDVIYQAIRTGLAIVTEGVLVAPLEGITGVKIRRNKDGTKYLALMFSGPIRSAGGTAQALTVLIGDLVRKKFGLDVFKPDDNIVNRYKEEIWAYRRSNTLQYTPSDHEIEIIVRNCPVCIDGEGTEKREVSAYRDIEGFTNIIRGGMVLVISEGICLKAKKLKKIIDANKIDGWDFINSLIDEKGKKKSTDDDGIPKTEAEYIGIEEDEILDLLTQDIDITPNLKYIKEVLAGRPIFSMPAKKGGFRLRYGRTRISGIASIAIHPATCVLLDNFPAIGTQIKIERPGKAGIVTLTDEIEGPIVLLKNGSLVEVRTAEEASSIKSQVERIVDLGEILIPFGEFLENNHKLMPGAYCVEWWIQEYARASGKDIDQIDRKFRHYDEIEVNEAVEISRRYGIPLHPAFNLFWHDLNVADIKHLRDHIIRCGRYDGTYLVLKMDMVIKQILINLGALHSVKEGHIYIHPRYSGIIPLLLGLDKNLSPIKEVDWEKQSNPMLLLYTLSGIKVWKRAPVRIGARMGRPEKAAPRKMSPPPHVLFPLGEAGGSQRLLKKAASFRKKDRKRGKRITDTEIVTRKITVDLGPRFCKQCRYHTPFISCPRCGNRTDKIEVKGNAPTKMEIDIGEVLDSARRHLNIQEIPNVKGVKGMTSAEKVPEPLEKGILRARYDVFVFKDGTCRYDMTDAPLTHFYPREIGVSVEMLRQLGYRHDAYGNDLVSEDQIVELKPQDIIPSEDAGYYLLNVARFIDEELKRFYGLEPFYRAKTPQDLIGHLVIGLAPHTSAGVVGRIIGYTKASVCYAHPYFHTAKRRNCDGDEDCIMLLMDGLLNFSKHYLPDKRGGQMDAPLVLTTRIDPTEVDKEVHNVDTVTMYPLEFYRMAMKGANPKEAAKIIDHIANRLKTPDQYRGLWFTTHAKDINMGPKRTIYKELKTMFDKMHAQMRIADIVDAVDANLVAEKVLKTHFLPDIRGNLFAFSRQSIRCKSCNKKYRRVPLRGYCPSCGSELLLTVHVAGVTKYLEKSLDLAKNYKIPSYLQQRLSLLNMYIKDTFGYEDNKPKYMNLVSFDTKRGEDDGKKVSEM